MFGGIVRAAIGERLARRGEGGRGALLAVAAPWILRRAFTPLGVAALGAYGAKKLWDRRQARRAATSTPTSV